MELLPALKFVQGAVARKDFVPALTHFRINNRTVRGFNGALAISCPIDCDLDISPKAVDFVKAINACTDSIALHVAKNGKLCVRSAKFTTHVDCDDPANFPDIRPDGRFIQLSDSLLPALRYLEPFIATDASRPWACGILFDDQSAFATNNIVLIQYWLGFSFPGRVNIPANAVRELIRIGENPIRLQVTENRLVFHYEDGRWLATQLFEAAWPDVNALLDKPNESPQEPFPEGLFAALEQLLPFSDELNRCYFHGDHISTVSSTDVSAGTTVVLPCPSAGVFNAQQLANLQEVAQTIGFSSYPGPVIFYGEKARGLIVGIRN